MKMPEGIIIKDKKTGKFVGFVDCFPGVWAQGDSWEEVKEKIEQIKKAFVKRLETTPVEMQEVPAYEL